MGKKPIRKAAQFDSLSTSVPEDAEAAGGDIDFDTTDTTAFAEAEVSGDEEDGADEEAGDFDFDNFASELDAASKALEAEAEAEETEALAEAVRGECVDPFSDAMFEAEFAEEKSKETDEEKLRQLTVQRRIFQMARRFFEQDKPHKVKGFRIKMFKHCCKAVFRGSRVIRMIDWIMLDWRKKVAGERAEKDREADEQAKEQWNELNTWLADTVAMVDPGDTVAEVSMDDQISEIRNLVADEEVAELEPELAGAAKLLAHSFDTMRKELKSLMSHSLHTLEKGDALSAEITETTENVRMLMAKFMGNLDYVKNAAEERANQWNAPDLFPDMAKNKKRGLNFSNTILKKIVKIADDVITQVDENSTGQVRRPKSTASSKGGKSSIKGGNSRPVSKLSSHGPPRRNSSVLTDACSHYSEKAMNDVACGRDYVNFRMLTAVSGVWKPPRKGNCLRVPPRLSRPRNLRYHTFDDKTEPIKPLSLPASGQDMCLRESVSLMWWQTSIEDPRLSVKGLVGFRGQFKLPPVPPQIDVEEQPLRGKLMNTLAEAKHAFVGPCRGTLNTVKFQTRTVDIVEEMWAPPVRNMLDDRKKQLPVAICLQALRFRTQRACPAGFPDWRVRKHSLTRQSPVGRSLRRKNVKPVDASMQTEPLLTVSICVQTDIAVDQDGYRIEFENTQPPAGATLQICKNAPRWN